MPNPIRLLIADDHTIIREGLSALLTRQADMTIVAEAANGQEAVNLFRLHQPHVTLMDVRMPRMDGIQAAQRIRREFPHACIVLLTSDMEGGEEAQARQAGVCACLLKDVSIHKLLEAIRAAALCSPTDPLLPSTGH